MKFNEIKSRCEIVLLKCPHRDHKDTPSQALHPDHQCNQLAPMGPASTTAGLETGATAST